MNAPSDCLEPIEYRNHTIKIFRDLDPPDPRREFDHLGAMVCFHRLYEFGDRHEFRNPQEFMDFLKAEKPVRLPLYLFDHSGITISTTSKRFRACDPDGWDWGLLGCIYVSKQDVRNEYGVNRVSRKVLEKVTKLLLAEVEEYDHYLTGNVYGYEITMGGTEVLGSSFGFFGAPEVCAIPAAKSAIDQLETEHDRH